MVCASRIPLLGTAPNRTRSLCGWSSANAGATARGLVAAAGRGCPPISWARQLTLATSRWPTAQAGGRPRSLRGAPRSKERSRRGASCCLLLLPPPHRRHEPSPFAASGSARQTCCNPRGVCLPALRSIDSTGTTPHLTYQYPPNCGTSLGLARRATLASAAGGARTNYARGVQRARANASACTTGTDASFELSRALLRQRCRPGTLTGTSLLCRKALATLHGCSLTPPRLLAACAPVCAARPGRRLGTSSSRALARSASAQMVTWACKRATLELWPRPTTS